MPNPITDVLQTKVAGREVTPGDAASTERLNRYWTEGAGAAKIRWGVAGDFMRCVRLLSKYIHSDEVVKGHCANLHKRATGARPGKAPTEQKSVTFAEPGEAYRLEGVDEADLTPLPDDAVPEIAELLDLGEDRCLMFGVDGSLLLGQADGTVGYVHGPVDAVDPSAMETKSMPTPTDDATAAGTDLTPEDELAAAAAADEAADGAVDTDGYETGEDAEPDADYDPATDPDVEPGDSAPAGAETKSAKSEGRDGASDGNTMGDGSYPIPDAEHVKKAVAVYPAGHGKGGKTKAGIRAHIVRHARRVGGLRHVPNNWPEKHAGPGTISAGRDTETKAFYPGSGAQYLPGSVEEMQQRIYQALWEAMLSDEDGDATTGSDGGGATPSNVGLSLVGTFDDHVTCTVVDYSDQTGADSQSYDVPFVVEDDGSITLGTPEPVDLVLTAQPDTDDDGGDGGGDLPNVDDTTGRGSAAPTPVGGVGAAVKALQDAMQTKGITRLGPVTDNRVRQAHALLAAAAGDLGVGLAPADSGFGTKTAARPDGLVVISEAEILDAERLAL